MTFVKLFGVRLEKFAQKPRTTETNVEHFSTPKGHLLSALTTRHLSANGSFTSCSSSTSLADKEIEKGAHGPQEKTVDGGMSEIFLNAAKSRLLTQRKRELMNEGDGPFCKEMRELPLKSSLYCGICCVKTVSDINTE